MISNGSILATMVSPILLYAGAGAMSVPILIHLLSKRRFRRIRWAAIDFVVEADRRNRRRVRIEEMILLGLRCLAMLLAGLMLARVFVRPEALTAVLGPAARTERIIVLDDSFSMGLLDRQRAANGGGSESSPLRPRGRASDELGPGEITVFDRAVSAVERLARWLREEAPGDPLTILLTSKPDSPLCTEASVGNVKLSALGDQLERLSPSLRGANVHAALASVRQRLEADESAVNAAVYVVSDFQQADWLPGAGQEQERGREAEGGTGAGPASAPGGGGHHVATALEDRADGERTLRIVLVDVGIAARDNVCVGAIEPQQSQAVAGISARFVARVTNFGRVESRSKSMRVYVGEAGQPPVTVPAIAPGQTIDVPLELIFPHEGSQTVTVKLEPDALAVDDERSCGLPVARALRVLVVNGEASRDPYQDEVFLLAVALRPEGPQFSGNEITVVDENEFAERQLAEFHVVVLANVFCMSEETAARLEAYVSAGGGVALFLGDQVDADLYNRTLYRDGTGLLPGRLGEIVTAPVGRPGVPVGEADLTHPAMRRFRGAEVSYFDGVVARQYVACEPVVVEVPSTAPAEVGIRPAGSAETEVDRRGPARVPLRLGDAERNSLIVERSLGRGRVWLITTTADKEWTNLADHPVFVVLAMEMVQHLARRDAEVSSQLVGEPIRFPLDLARYQPAATLKPPSYPQEPAARVEVQPDKDSGIPTIRWEGTDQPGIYKFELRDLAGAPRLEQVAVNVDPRESDLRRADRVSLLASMAGLPVEYVRGDDVVGGRNAEARRELWPGLLIAILVVLMTEQALACWFGSSRRIES